MLFIDEAYSLCRRGGGNTDTQEAMDQLVALMTEPEHLHKTVVILAGYKNEMDRMLSSVNPGKKCYQSRRRAPSRVVETGGGGALRGGDAYALQQEVLQRSGICPAGFLRHRGGSGWRCGWGSHRVEDL